MCSLSSTISHAALFTETILPLRQVMPLLLKSRAGLQKLRQRIQGEAFAAAQMCHLGAVVHFQFDRIHIFHFRTTAS